MCFVRMQGQEFTEQYVVEYQRQDDGRWFRFHNRRGYEVPNHHLIVLTVVKICVDDIG